MRPTRAVIDLEALRSNVEGIRRRVTPGVKIMGLVKANAYGHGLAGVAEALVGCGVDYLGVGFLEEGIALRESGIRAPILVLGGVLGSQVAEFLAYDLEITVSSLEIAGRIAEAAGPSGRARVHLKIDTGMERIGVHAAHAVPFVERVAAMQGIEVVGLYSHLATADERDKSFAREQLARFRAVVEGVGAKGIRIPLIHIANSGAILDLPDSWYTMVRPGIMLYGVYPSKETSAAVPLAPVLSLVSKVVYIKEVAAGSAVSYGRTFTTKRDTKIATVPAGYGDGFSRRLSNRGSVLIRGRRYPVAGTICMDQFMVDVGPEADIHVGDDVVLIGSAAGESISAWDVADMLGTIPYEIFTGITARVPRLFIS